MENEFLDVALDLDLEPVKLDNLDIKKQISQTITDLFPEAPGVTSAIENTIRVEPGATLLHKNLMHYLTLAWYNHFSVVISPDMIFYTILCELAEIIKKQPEAFRHLFTDSTEKKQILTVANNGRIDLDQVVAALSKNIAVDASLFTAEFSTTNNESRLAIQAAFCDAMSPYYYYSRSRCGIPRIKILGTKQDWQTLEKKLHRMATEVFNQKIGSSEDADEDDDRDNRVVQYLKEVIEVVQKIQTDNTKEFWEKMYQIDKCRSGHTAFVKGWINKLYRSGGNDFYNYKPHVSLVTYKDLDTQKDYELRCGLLYSSIEQGTSELDMKFPWLVPHFAHVVLDKSVKMTPEQYKTYIDKAVTGDFHDLFTNFFDLIKDDPIILGSSDEQPRQSLEIIGRQLDYWIAHPDQISQVDFSMSKFEPALRDYGSESLKLATEILLPRLKTLFDTCQLRSVNLDVNAFHALEDKLIEFLVGNPYLEELVIDGYELVEWINEDTDDEQRIYPALIALCTLLSHPQCRVKSLKISGNPKEGATVALAKVILNMQHPLEKIEVQRVADIELADAIFELSKKGYLKRLYCDEGNHPNVEANKKILSAIATSRTLEDVQIFTCGWDCPNEVFEELAINLPQNTNLQQLKLKMQYHRDYFDKELLHRMLSIPSLRKLYLETSTDFKFISNTPLLQHLTVYGSGSHGSQLAEYLKSDTCQLEHLDLNIGEQDLFLDELCEALETNKSLQTFDIRSGYTREKTPITFGQSLARALKNRIPLRLIRIKNFAKLPSEETEKIISAMIDHPFLEGVFISYSEIISEQGMEDLIQLIKKNRTIKELHISSGAHSVKDDLQIRWTDEQRKRLTEALNQNDTLVRFHILGVPTSEYKQKSSDRYW